MSYNSSPHSPKHSFPFKNKCMQNYCKESGGNIPPSPLCWRESALGGGGGGGGGGGLSVSSFGVLSFYTNQNGIVVCCPAE